MTNLHYHEINPHSDKIVIMIHGLGANYEMWEFQFEPFAKAGWRIIAPDMRGFGKSPEGAEKITIENMAKDVAGLMDKLNIKKAHIVGLSMGGAIAQSFALQFPERVEKLVLSNTAARFANKFFGMKYLAMRYVLLKLIPREKGARSIAKFVFPKKDQQNFRDKFIEQILMASDSAYFQATKAIINHDLREQVGNIKSPTLVVAGKHDKVTMPFILRKLHERIPGSKIVTLSGGHVTPVDSADEFNKEVLDFLS